VPVPTSSHQAAQSVEQLLEALVEARQAIRASEVTLRRALKKVDQGSSVASAVLAVNPAETRQRINDALLMVEQRRHDARRTVFAAALEEGMSVSDLARAWGFSRQMAARYAKEARGQG
jgi:hypothetical protein